MASAASTFETEEDTRGGRQGAADGSAGNWAGLFSPLAPAAMTPIFARCWAADEPRTPKTLAGTKDKLGGFTKSATKSGFDGIHKASDSLHKAADLMHIPHIDVHAAGDMAFRAADVAAEQTRVAAVMILRIAITFVLAPFCVLFMSTVFTDVLVSTKHPFLSFSFLIMVVSPTASFIASCYMLISFWMDEDGQTLMRYSVMYANIPMCAFFALILMNQSSMHTFGLECGGFAFLGQVFYGQMNLWHTMTVDTLYKLCEGKGKIEAKKVCGLQERTFVHLVCWCAPVVLTYSMWHLENKVFHEDLWEEDLRGLAWCGVKSENRILKAVFVNAPQLMTVSFYAQFYYYVHHGHIDPKEDTSVNGALGQTIISASSNTALLNMADAQRQQAMQEAAKQQRFYMTIYVMSFLTNTMIGLVSDNMGAGPPSDWALLAQSALVTPSGFFIALVFSRTAKSLLGAYYDTWVSFKGRKNLDAAIVWKHKKEAAMKRREMLAERMRDKRARQLSAASSFASAMWMLINASLMFIVGVWVWTPMEFLSENLSRRAHVLGGLLIWGIVSVFPFYWFSLTWVASTDCLKDWVYVNPSTEGQCVYLFEYGAQGYFVFIFLLAALSVWNNRDTHKLLLIEGPVRKKGIFSSIGMGLRLNSARNSMSIFTSCLEFYQIWGLTWSASQMDTRYTIEELPSWYRNTTEFSDADSGSFMGNETATSQADGLAIRDLLTYYVVIAMCFGWAVLYSLPVVLTTISVGNRRLAFELSESYRKYLWFMSGAGFLTILKALIKIQFCIPHPMVADGKGPLVALTHHSIECWGSTHLRMVAVALLSLAIFFPAASLTTLFRYDDEDDRCPTKPISCGLCGPQGKTGCVLGGEDIRWIHLWRRVEYMVKGMWVFTGYRLVEYGKGTAFALFAGSFIIVWANSLMKPSNLRWVCDWKLLIHVCNCWTTSTCLWAAYSDNRDKQLHLSILVAGWVLIGIVMFTMEYMEFSQDGFLKPQGDAKNIEAQTRIVEELAEQLQTRTGIRAWGAHATIVRLVRLAEHPDESVRTLALTQISKLAFLDQMTSDRSFFMSLTPTRPTVQILLDAITTTETDSATKNLATRALVTFLQENIGNEFGLPVTYHERVMTLDEQQEGQITADLFKYAFGDLPREESQDAMLLILELCKADSNKLVLVGEICLPDLALKMKTGSMMEQYASSLLAAMTANRFDLADKIIHSPILDATIQLFKVVNACFKNHQQNGGTGSSKNQSVDGFHKDSPPPNVLKAPCRSLPAHLRQKRRAKDRFSANLSSSPRPSMADTHKDLDVFEAETSSSHQSAAFVIEEWVSLTAEEMQRIMTDIMRHCLQLFAELAGASRAKGRRKLIEAGGLVLIQECKATFNEQGVPEQEDEVTMLLEDACLAAHALLSGRFGMDDIRCDRDFSKSWDLLSGWKAECEANNDLAAELKLPLGMTPLQRRKAHIICVFLKLGHNSVGGLQNRRVVAKMEEQTITNPLLKSADGQAIRTKGSALHHDSSIGAQSDDKSNDPEPSWYDWDEMDIYKWNWEAVASTDYVQELLSLTASPCPALRFHSVDLLSKIAEHSLEPAESSDVMLGVMINAIISPDSDRPIQLLGAAGCSFLVSNRGSYKEYGCRSRTLKGKALFRWGARMLVLIAWWDLNSGGMPDLLIGDTGFGF
eukprot:SAG31_NODE_46_length_30980_cov_226.095107_7_plen_1671_part_00